MTVAELDSQLCFAVYSASSRISGIYRPLLEPLGLTYTQFIVLMALWQEENISISKLAEKVDISKATMTPLLKRLEKKALIRREILASNERQKNIVLTEDGRKLSQRSAEITKQAFCATGLSRQQANDLIALCKNIEKTPARNASKNLENTHEL